VIPDVRTSFINYLKFLEKESQQAAMAVVTLQREKAVLESEREAALKDKQAALEEKEKALRERSEALSGKGLSEEAFKREITSLNDIIGEEKGKRAAIEAELAESKRAADERPEKQRVVELEKSLKEKEADQRSIDAVRTLHRDSFFSLILTFVHSGVTLGKA